MISDFATVGVRSMNLAFAVGVATIPHPAKVMRALRYHISILGQLSPLSKWSFFCRQKRLAMLI